MSKVIKKIGKILLHSLSGVVLVAILLILGVAIALSLPRVQSFVASKAVDFLSEKTSTHLAIDAISIENLSKICVEGLYIEDLQGDTLLYFSKVRGTIDRSALFSEGKLLPSNIEGERGVMNLVTLDNEENDNLTQLIDQIASHFPASEEENSGSLTLSGIKVRDFVFRLYDQELAGRVPEGSIDYSDMDLKVSSTDMERIEIKDGVVGLYGASNINAVDKSGALLEDSSFGWLKISEGTLDFKDIDFTTNDTHLLLPYLIIKGRTWDEYQSFCDKVTLSLKTAGSTLEPVSAGKFVAVLGDIAIRGQEIVGTFDGTVNDFRADISATLYDSDVVVDGSVENITKFDKLAVDATIDLATTSQRVSEIYGHIVGGDMPTQVSDWLSRFATLEVAGSASLHPGQIVADATLATNLGSVDVDGTLRYGHSNTRFEGSISGDGVEVGKILRHEQLGKADLTLEGTAELVDGTPGGDLKAIISRIGWGGYDYNNLNIQASLQNGDFRTVATSSDPNIEFSLEGDGSLAKARPEYNVILSLERADFGALGLIDEQNSSWLTCNMEATLSGRSLDDMVGRAMINNFTYATATDTLSTELVNIALRGDEHDKSFSLRSNIADVEYRSTASYGQVIDYITRSLPASLPWARPTTESTEEAAEPLADRLYMAEDYTSVNLKIFDGENLASVLLPEGSISSGSSAVLECSPSRGEFWMEIDSDMIELQDVAISDVNVTVGGHGKSMNLRAESSSLKAASLLVPDLSLQVASNDNHEVDANIYFSDTDTAVSGQLGFYATFAHNAAGALTASAKLHDSYIISPEQRWTILSDGIDYTPEGVTIDSFTAHSGVSSISLSGAISKLEEHPLELSLENVTIGEWVALFTPLKEVRGNLSGNVELHSALEQPYGQGELRVASLRMGDLEVDPMILAIEIPRKSTTAAISLRNTLSRNTLARGNYNYSTGDYQAKLSVNEFQFSLLEPILKGVAHDIDGLGHIDLSLSGSGSEGVDIVGQVKASELGATIDFTGAHYTIPSLKLAFKDKKGTLSPIRIEDKEGGWASAEATIGLERLNEITYEASVEPHNLVAIDISEDSQSPFYGKVYVADGGIKLSSKSSATTISGAINTGSGSVFSIPLKGNSDFAGADFVTFVSNNSNLENQTTNGHSATLQRQNGADNGSNLAVDMMLGVDTNTLLRLIIDPETDNIIEARGNANLGITLDARKSEFAIRGDYQISEGVYNFNFQNLITKTFDINPGSYIRWNGSPLDANIDVAATYKLKTSLAPLLGTESTASRASTPVECIVKLTGSLAKVDVSFDINVPTANTEYQTILSSYFSSQEMMATQFVYLLALGNFYSDSSSGQTTTAGTAGTAIGLDFLASQVSRLVSNDTYKLNLKYKAIDDTSSSYSVDFQTEIIDDRLTLELEANLDTGDYYQTIGNDNQISAGGSVTVRLDPSGSVYLKGFSRTIDRFDENQGLQENGIGLYFQRSFNRINELWSKKKGNNGEEESEKSGTFVAEESPAEAPNEMENEK